ncbi:CD59 glycoprotein-like [Mugil cephalus]|uniref:CD59 glycoprotein-like n=1 Tax=Mugil cephalus TaxID=48193 RepID=UPI001FB83852|nr:CD59 glycoprotein-like [Mugil cephalus]
MRSSVVFCVAVSFAMFGFGLSLQCYSCPQGSTSGCDVKQECSSVEDACLKVTIGDIIHTECIRYADCDVRILAQKFLVPQFTSRCCQTSLCNGKSWLERLKEKFSG